jgi:hypothetical protein
MRIPDTPKFCGVHHRVPRKSNAGRSIGVLVMVGLIVAILIVAMAVM